jgi:hypothetical protein
MKLFFTLEKRYGKTLEPYYNNYPEYDSFGFKDRFWVTEDEALNFRLSESIKKRISSAKVGTEIKIRHSSSSTEVYLKRVSDGVFNEFVRQKEIKELKKKLNKSIRKKCRDEFEQLDILNKEEKILEKKIEEEIKR